jgi:hypothetical protein
VEFFQKVQSVYNFRCVYNVQYVLSIDQHLDVARLGCRVLTDDVHSPDVLSVQWCGSYASR